MFRKIEEKDREVFIEMSEEFYHSPAVLHPINPEYHTNTFNELMRSREYLECYIMDEDSRIAGYCLLNKSYQHECGGKILWVEELYVRPDFQGMGLGSKMPDFVEEDNPGVSRIRLETEPDNYGAKRLYERKGYKFLAYQQYIKE